MNNKSRQKNIEKIKADLEKLVRDGEKLLKDEASNVVSNGGDLRKQLVETMNSAKEYCAEMETKARSQLNEIDDSVHNSPYKFAGIACALGLMVGLFVNRSND